MKDDLWKIHSNIIDLIKHADAKANTLLVGIGIIAAILLSDSTLKREILFEDKIVLILIVLAVISVCLTLYNIVQSLKPVVYIEGTETMIFFRHICGRFKTAQDYKSEFNEIMTEEKLIDDIKEQIWVNASIAQKKYEFVIKAVRFFSITVIILVLIILVDKI